MVKITIGYFFSDTLGTIRGSGLVATIEATTFSNGSPVLKVTFRIERNGKPKTVYFRNMVILRKFVTKWYGQELRFILA
jgi:hypothetical protein